MTTATQTQTAEGALLEQMRRHWHIAEGEARLRTIPTPAPAHCTGFQIREVHHDPGPGQWLVEFEAGGRLYRYHADRSPQAHALEVQDGWLR